MGKLWCFVETLYAKDVHTQSEEAVRGDNTARFCLPDMWKDGSLGIVQK